MTPYYLGEYYSRNLSFHEQLYFSYFFPILYNLMGPFGGDYTARGDLAPMELFCRDHVGWLEEKGYIVRGSRSHTNWYPSWFIDLSKPYKDFKDSHWEKEEYLIEGTEDQIRAVRLENGEQVILKIIRRSGSLYEASVASFFSSSPLAFDPRNHCVPVEVHQVPDEEDMVLLVMPDLEEAMPFETVGEVLEMIRQLFEGILFTHSHNIAHCCSVSPYGPPKYPSMFRKYEIAPPGSLPWITYHNSRTMYPVKYYMEEFASATYCSPDVLSEEKPLPGSSHSGGTASESKEEGRYDPFREDVFRAGQIIERHFLKVFNGSGKWVPTKSHNLYFLEPLIGTMVHEDPNERPTMSEVARQFEAICGQLHWWQLRAPVKKEKRGKPWTHWKKQIRFMWRGIPSIPVPN